MIECPVCKHKQFVGTLFCSECGTRLVHGEPIPTMTVSRDVMTEDAMATKPTVPEGPELSSGALIGLRVVTSGDVVSLIGRESFSIGRAAEGQAILPDVDLSEFDAYNQGVSRMHAEIRLRSDGAYVVDLESANGTLVNNNRLKALRNEQIGHGDVIQLGRLRLQVISRYRN
jgi:pSer/pThr/pTyr-binding forkhead associated (FHA) protein